MIWTVERALVVMAALALGTSAATLGVLVQTLTWAQLCYVAAANATAACGGAQPLTGPRETGR